MLFSDKHPYRKLPIKLRFFSDASRIPEVTNRLVLLALRFDLYVWFGWIARLRAHLPDRRAGGSEPLLPHALAAISEVSVRRESFGSGRTVLAVNAGTIPAAGMQGGVCHLRILFITILAERLFGRRYPGLHAYTPA